MESVGVGDRNSIGSPGRKPGSLTGGLSFSHSCSATFLPWLTPDSVCPCAKDLITDPQRSEICQISSCLDTGRGTCHHHPKGHGSVDHGPVAAKDPIVHDLSPPFCSAGSVRGYSVADRHEDRKDHRTMVASQRRGRSRRPQRANCTQRSPYLSMFPILLRGCRLQFISTSTMEPVDDHDP